MPYARHARLRVKLISAINSVAEAKQIAYAFPGLKCRAGKRSIVSNIAVLRWQQIELDQNGEVIDDVRTAPAWAIEILSPGQSPNHAITNILHFLKHGGELGWVIDPDWRSIHVILSLHDFAYCREDDRLIVMEGLDLELTVNQVFGWLKMKA